VAAKSVSPSKSESVDDYLKAILELGGAEDSRVTTNALAGRLGVRTPSVTGMLQKLASQRPALVLYEKHRGVRLTSTGKRRAWELVRHHRLLELFLHDVLKYSWDEVHEEAERLEHFISERFEDRVAAIHSSEVQSRCVPQGSAAFALAAPNAGGHHQRFRSECRRAPRVGATWTGARSLALGGAKELRCITFHTGWRPHELHPAR
jgi:DtxR family Mn-dependent transcriptional regulator